MKFKSENAEQAYTEVLKEAGRACARVEEEMSRIADPMQRLTYLTLLVKLRIAGVAQACEAGARIDTLKAVNTVGAYALMHQLGISGDDD